jgi:PAS domain S-box-containing protein
MAKRVLIADDNSTNLYMLETMLKAYGFEVISAQNGKEALDKALLNPPDLIVTDILMPVMDGYTLCRQWKSDDKLKHIPLVFYTATYTESKDEAFALSLGADLFILKPKEPDIFMNIIKEVLEEKYTARQVLTKPLGEEMEFFRQHNEILFNKLEKKMSDLEIANQNLRILEENYRQIFENAMDVIYSIGADLNIISISPSMERILGYKPQDFIGRPVSDLENILGPESFRQAVDDIILILKGQTITARVLRFIARDGTSKYGEVSSAPIIHEGKIIGSISIARDITERKQSEAALKESKERYNAIFERSLDIVYVHDFEGNFIDANSASLRLLGYNREDIPQMNLASLMDSGEISKALQLIDELKRTGTQEEFSEFRLKCKDGRHIDMETKSSVIMRDDKQYAVLGIGRDITERKRAEDNLRLSEEKYRLLLDHAAEGIFVVQEGMLKFVNPATILISGRPEKDLISRPFTEFIHPEDREKVLEHYKKRISGEEEVPTSYIFRIMTRDGFVKWVEIHVALIFWEGNAATLNFMIDITERKRADEALRQSNARFRSYFELPLVGIAITSPEKGWIEANDRLLDILGYSWQELQNMTWAELTHHEDLDADVEQFNRVLANEIDSYMIDKRFIRKDGEFIWTSLAVGCVRKPYGTVDYFVALFEDITERKRAEDEQKESEKKYRLLADNVDDVIFVLDMNLNFTYVSPSVKILIGYEPEEFLKLRSSEAMTPTSWDLVVRNLSEIMELEKAGNRESSQYQILQLEMRRKDGSTVWTEVKASFIRDENQRLVSIIGVTRDITERREAEEQLQRTLKSLRNSFGATVQVMVAAIESKDPYTAGHQHRAAKLACAIAGEMGLPQDKIEGLQMAGAIHDIGKLSIPAEILTKPTKLTDLEFSLIKEHPRIGYEMLKDVESPWPLAQIVYQHHERINGSGYPRKLKGDEILMEARIMAVADVVEAMGSHRPYRPTLGIEIALEEITKNKSILYDNAVVDACLKLFREKGYQL